jgi:penicillin-binding protein 1C
MMREIPRPLRGLLRRHLPAAAAGMLALLLPLILFLLADRMFPFPLDQLQRPPAVAVEDRDGEPLRFFLPPDDRWRIPVSLEQLPPLLVETVVASEDRWFRFHPGVNPAAAARAALQNLRQGRVVSGASTIPMQIARMADPARRTLGAKLRESARALQLNWHCSKQRQLEIYFNLAPYGGNIEGVTAASWLWFGKSPLRLSVGEMALLVALPRAPNRFDPTRHPEAAREARDGVLRLMEDRGLITVAEGSEARRQPLPRGRSTLPFAAPHFARFVASRSAGRARVRTTLHRPTQALAEAQVARRIGNLRQAGIGSAAVVVLETGTREVRAMVGSAGFFEEQHQGQVNGALARRSPGSTLKPLLYAMAVDQGLLVPESYLLDIPTDFSGYVAKNFDDRYRGRVTAREALAQSLNAAAVRLLARAGLERFHRLLVRGGAASLDRPALAYGLPLVLGAGDMTLLELTGLYAALAGGGTGGEVRWAEGGEAGGADARNGGQRLFSEEAAWLVTSILLDVRRPDLPDAWALTRDAPAVAWKTGTSYGHRDAWAVGFSGRHTVGVWVGNFDGTPVNGISGSEYAAPLLFDIFRALEPGGTGPREPAGLALVPVTVCSLSRQLPTAFCPERMEVRCLAEGSHLGRCGYHRRMLVDAETGLRLTGDCVGTRPHRWELLTVYPAELVAWWRARGQPVPVVPAVSPDCGGVEAGEGPKIVSPDGSTGYRLRRDTPAEYQQVPLLARVAPGTSRLYWYEDGQLAAAGSPGEQLFIPLQRGEHRVVVTDDTGRSDGVTYRVE